MFRLLLSLLVLTLIQACGGSGGGTDPVAPPLVPMVDSFGQSVAEADFGGGDAGAAGADGTAGDGAPLTGALVTIVDAAGRRVSGQTDARGYYRLRIDGFLAPMVASVVRSDGTVWYSPSVATAHVRGFVTINLTGLTDKLASDVALSAGKSSAAELTPAILAANPTALADAKSRLNTELSSVIAAAGLSTSNFDPVTMPFRPDLTGYDKVLESVVIQKSVSGATVIATEFGLGLYHLDPEFKSPPSFRERVYPWRATAGSGGRVYISSRGSSVPLDGVGAQRIGAVIRLNSDGSVDTGFAPGAKLTDAFAVLELPDGRVLVGGEASDEPRAPGAYPVSRVFRLLPDGQLDATYRSPAFDGTPRFMTLQPDGKLLVVVHETSSANSGALTGLQRLNPDGSIDTSFTAPALNDGAIYFTNIVVDTAGRILVGGNFTSAGGTARPGLMRLLPDGALDMAFAPDGMVNVSAIRGIALQTRGANAGKVVVVGTSLRTTMARGEQPTCPNGGSAKCIALRLNADGSLDAGFTLLTKASAGWTTGGGGRMLALLPDDRLLTVSQGLVRLTADGAVDPAYQKPVFGRETYWLEMLADGSAYVPMFSTANTVNSAPAPHDVLRFDADGRLDTRFAPAAFYTETYPTDATALPDGRWMVFGSFSHVGEAALPGAVRLRADGTVDPTYTLSGMGDLLGLTDARWLSNGSLLAMAVTGTDPNMSSARRLVRFNAAGALDASYAPATAVAEAREIRLMPDGGALGWTIDDKSTLDGTFAVRRLLPDGNLDPAFTGPAVPGGRIGAVHPDGSLSVGSFRIVGSYPDGRLLAATTVPPYAPGSSSFRFTLQRLLPNGAIDPSFSAPTLVWENSVQYLTSGDDGTQRQATQVSGSPIVGVAAHADGSVVMFGSFTQLDGKTVGGVARLTATGAVDTGFAAGAGAQWLASPSVTAEVREVVIDAAGRYWAAGLFDTFGGKPHSGLVRLLASGAVDPEYESALQYRPYTSAPVSVRFDSNSQPMVFGTFARAADVFPTAMHRLAYRVRP